MRHGLGRLTVLVAPARVLNRVAVTTRRFLGSTAPTATSGVSTTATSLGGAVRTAARPNRIANGDPETGVPTRGEPSSDVGVKGPVEVFNDKRPLGPALPGKAVGLFDAEATREPRR